MTGITTRKEAVEILRKTAGPIPPGLKFKIDRFKPEDAWGVVQCCYSIYGGGYPVDTYYIPEKLIAENRNGNIYGAVARTESGEVVGYGALYRSAPPFAGIYEAGQLIVRQEYRCSRAAYGIQQFLLNKLTIEVGLDAYFAEATCTQLVVQKMARKSGSLETGIELDLMPEEAFEARGAQAGRMAAVLMFKVLKDSPHDIYLPETYMGIVGRCVRDMGLSRSVKSLEECTGGTGECLSSQHYFEEAAVARLSFAWTGADAGPIIGDFESKVSAKGCNVRQVFINIGDPCAGDVFKALLSNGYFFGGYLPRWFDTDGLLLQKLTGEPDPASIKLYSDWAKELLEFTLKDRERASG